MSPDLSDYTTLRLRNRERKNPVPDDVIERHDARMRLAYSTLLVHDKKGEHDPYAPQGKVWAIVGPSYDSFDVVVEQSTTTEPETEACGDAI